ncbi:helix-turn-helix transcriptional regulator [Acetatifactor muris]|uniref:helix-turn-helix transcriptional regulator n=1 Tax=Acetatifactor muris TaxID=879566 RepID=UPI0023F505A2|nr:AraC family transcriptional regulator [Acetatifactor muris]
MLRRNDLPFYMEMTACDTLRDRHNLPGQDTDMENQLLYVANGSCYVKVSDRTIKAAYRSIVYFHRYVKYDLEIPSGENNLVYRLHFRPSQNSAHLDLDTLCQNNDIIDGFMNYRNRYCILYDQENTSSTINELIREFHAPSPQKDIMMTALLTVLYIKMSRTFFTKRKAAGIHYISEAKKYIAEHSSEPLTIQQIADAVGISRSHLESLFSKYAGRRITTHINTVRADRAAALLTLTRKDILEVALEVGYENRQHFAREFRRRHGISPSQYRKLYGTIGGDGAG